MLTMSVNPDIKAAVRKMNKVMTKELNEFTRPYLGAMFLAVVEEHIEGQYGEFDSGTKPKYTNLESYTTTTIKNELINKTERELNIVNRDEFNLGYRSGVLENVLVAKDRVSTFESSDDLLVVDPQSAVWFDICDMAYTDFGVNLMKCVDLLVNGVRLGEEVFIPMKTIIKNKVRKTLLTVVRAYGQEELLRDMIHNPDLMLACMDEERYTKYGNELGVSKPKGAVNKYGEWQEYNSLDERGKGDVPQKKARRKSR